MIIFTSKTKKTNHPFICVDYRHPGTHTTISTSVRWLLAITINYWRTWSRFVPGTLHTLNTRHPSHEYNVSSFVTAHIGFFTLITYLWSRKRARHVYRHITTLIVAYRQYTHVSLMTFTGLFGQQVIANIVSKRWDLTKPLFQVGAKTRQEVWCLYKTKS